MTVLTRRKLTYQATRRPAEGARPALLTTERHTGIDLDGASCRNIRGNQSYNDKQKRHCEKRCRIGCRRSIKKLGKELGQQNESGDSEGDADRKQNKAMAQE